MRGSGPKRGSARQQKAKKRKLIAMVAGTLVLGLVAGVVAMIWNLLNQAPGKGPKTVQQISLIKPPPPPPPPKVEEPPPEPEEQKIEEPKPEPEPKPVEESNEPPPGEDLGVDADGAAGADGFGLVGKKGGSSLIGGNTGSKFGWYAGILQQDIQSHLADKSDLRSSKYSVIVKIWVGADGRIQRSELVTRTGVSEVDQSLQLALSGDLRLREPPPQDMPQPIKLRITSRI